MPMDMCGLMDRPWVVHVTAALRLSALSTVPTAVDGELLNGLVLVTCTRRQALPNYPHALIMNAK